MTPREQRLWQSTMLCRLITRKGWDGRPLSPRLARCYRHALHLANGPLTGRLGARANVGVVVR